jgi:hypothetical protein
MRNLSRLTLFFLIVIAALSGYAQTFTFMKGTGTVVLRRDNQKFSAFANKLLADKTSVTLNAADYTWVTDDNDFDDNGWVNNLRLMAFPAGAGTDLVFGFHMIAGVLDNVEITKGNYCLGRGNKTTGKIEGGVTQIGLGGEECEEQGPMTITDIDLRYPTNRSAWIRHIAGRFRVNCFSDTRSTLDVSFALDFTHPNPVFNTGSPTKPANAQTPAPAPPTSGACANDPDSQVGGNDGNGGGGGGTGGTGGPFGGIFPGFGGFGPGAGGGGGSGGGGGTDSPSFLTVDIDFDLNDGIPSLENTEVLQIPLTVASANLPENVSLAASADGDGLDFSFFPSSLPPNNDFNSTILSIKPHPDAMPRDYLVTVTATSGDKKSQTSFLVSLTCNTPFISSLSTSQPQSQTINRGTTTKLSVTALGTGPFAYQWYRGTTGNTQFPVDGATSREFTTPALQNQETYWVRVSNPCGTADSNPATVSVR